MSLKPCFIFAISVDLDKMPSYAVFQLGLHCLPKYLFNGNQKKDKQILMYYNKGAMMALHRPSVIVQIVNVIKFRIYSTTYNLQQLTISNFKNKLRHGI